MPGEVGLQMVGRLHPPVGHDAPIVRVQLGEGLGQIGMRVGIRIQDRQLRLRKLVIQPGGVVPWHSHGDRPAIIYIIEGEIVEYATACAVPIVHKAGDVAREIHTTSHWWKNIGDKTVVLLSADILHDKSDKNM